VNTQSGECCNPAWGKGGAQQGQVAVRLALPSVSLSKFGWPTISEISCAQPQERCCLLLSLQSLEGFVVALPARASRRKSRQRSAHRLPAQTALRYRNLANWEKACGFLAVSENDGRKNVVRERVQLGKDILPKSACMPLEELRGLPVLIVDDNLTHLQSLTGMVDSYGMAMTAVISALQEERQLVRGSG